MKLIDYLKFEEGLRLESYQDQFGVWTVGYGDTGPHVGPGQKITQADAEARLATRARLAEVDAVNVVGRDAWLHMNDVRRIVVSSMAYQMGAGGLAKFKRTVAAIRVCDWRGASVAMLASAWADQTPNRAHRSAAMMLTGTPWLA